MRMAIIAVSEAFRPPLWRVLLLTALFARASFAGPSLSFDQAILHLTPPLPGEASSSGAFCFSNITQSAVRIISVTSSCSCTHAVATEGSVAPGAVARLLVSLDTAGRYGLQRKRLIVKTDQGEKYTLTVVLELPAAPPP